GRYAQRDAPALYRRAHLLLHTKRNDPCPNVVLEALSCGLPVVHSASGGLPELVGREAGIGVPDEGDWEHDVPPDPEALAVGDGSTDSTPDILAAAAARDPRIRLHRQEPGGLTAALNAGCALARAPLIARMDSDDVMIGHRLERQVVYLRKHPEVAVLGGG